MMPIAWDAWSSWVAGRLLAGSLQGAVAVALVWLVCRRFPAIPASVRSRVWWVVSLGLLLSLSALPSFGAPQGQSWGQFLEPRPKQVERLSVLALHRRVVRQASRQFAVELPFDGALR